MWIKTFDIDLRELDDTLRKENFDWYIGIARHGIVVMYFFAMRTNQQLMDIFCEGQRKDWTHISGKKILLIDDTIETGKEMASAKKELESWNPSSIKILVLKRLKCAHWERGKFFSAEDLGAVPIEPDFCLEYEHTGLSISSFFVSPELSAEEIRKWNEGRQTPPENKEVTEHGN